MCRRRFLTVGAKNSLAPDARAPHQFSPRKTIRLINTLPRVPQARNIADAAVIMERIESAHAKFIAEVRSLCFFNDASGIPRSPSENGFCARSSQMRRIIACLTTRPLVHGGRTDRVSQSRQRFLEDSGGTYSQQKHCCGEMMPACPPAGWNENEKPFGACAQKPTGGRYDRTGNCDHHRRDCGHKV